MVSSSRSHARQCKASAAAVKFLGAGALVLWGCARPALVAVEEDVAPDRALVLLAVRTTIGAAPVQITIGRDGMLSAALRERNFVVGSGGAAGLETGALLAFTAPAGAVRVAVARIGDFWEFAGGGIEHVLQAEASRAYYLGTLELEFSEEAGAAGMVFYDDEPPRAGAPPLQVDTRPPPSRALACGAKIIDEEPAARAVVRERFAALEPAFANRTGGWRRVPAGGLWGAKTATPVPVERRP
ncbi:MAG TPA: hypothetical protein PKX48_06170 [Planctomycetota bacterium]|jgi:hypothetical protein|nr:hypothetical protein [Planctomycetota bacterium]HNR99473.1 hypothetical protein [Planctomycetota bacterium]HNU26338.1 hypothetical protein [Planctomycetota bacterium]HOE30527.1 hypothetical protein [Planctomycetota bacterium]HOE86737.1 hypothetical protein [Planctomycetota bacterium]